MKISELTEVQRSHLAYRLDNNTCVGYITACKIARLELGDDEVVDIFKKAGRPDRSAKALAKKVECFKAPDHHEYHINLSIRFEDVVKDGARRAFEKALSVVCPMYISIIADHAKIWKQDVEQSLAADLTSAGENHL